MDIGRWKIKLTSALDSYHMLSIRTSALTLSVPSICLRLMKPLSVILTFSRPWPPPGQNKSLVARGLSDQTDSVAGSGCSTAGYDPQ